MAYDIPHSTTLVNPSSQPLTARVHRLRERILAATAPGGTLADLRDVLNELHIELEDQALRHDHLGIDLSNLPTFTAEAPLPEGAYSADAWFILVRDDDDRPDGPWYLERRAHR